MASFGSRLCRLALSYGVKMQPRLLQRTQSLQQTGRRYFFDSELLGLGGYKKIESGRRSVLQPVLDTFKEQMAKARSKGQVPRVQDLTSMIYISESKEDLDLLKSMVCSYAEHKDSSAKPFAYGPILMRKLHILNEPKLALELYMDERLSGDFVYDSAIRALTDLLFRNEMYAEVLQVFHIHQTQSMLPYLKQDLQTIHHAASLKVNTPESLNDVIKVQTATNVKHHRALVLACLLAIKQGKPDVAEQFMEGGKKLGHISAILACMRGNAQDAVSYIEFHASKNVPTNTEVVESIEAVVKKTNDPVLEERFNTAKNQLAGKISDHSLEYFYLNPPLKMNTGTRMQTETEQKIDI